MVGDKDPGSFSIETNIVIVSMLVWVETRYVAVSNSFHFALITIFLFLVFIFNLPGLSGLSKAICIGIPLSRIFRVPYDLSFEHLVAKLLLDLGSNREPIESVLGTCARKGEID